MWPDNEQATGPNFELIPAAPISARYVRYCLTPWGTVAPKRGIGVTEIQVYDSITYVPFDMKLAPPPAFAGGGSTASSPPSGAGGAAPNAQAPKKQTTKKPFAPSRSVTPVLIRKTTK
jgi:hypothetical protein